MESSDGEFWWGVGWRGLTASAPVPADSREDGEKRVRFDCCCCYAPWNAPAATVAVPLRSYCCFHFALADTALTRTATCHSS